MPEDDSTVDEKPNRQRFSAAERLLLDSEWGPAGVAVVISVALPLAIYTSARGALIATIPGTESALIPSVLLVVAVLWVVLIGANGGLPRNVGGGR